MATDPQTRPASTSRRSTVRGRTFTAEEVRGAPHVVVVSEATARRYWPGEDPIGQSVLMGDTHLEVIGIAGDAHVSSVADIDSSYMYLPIDVSTQRGLSSLVRSQADFTTVARSVADMARELDPSLLVQMVPLERSLEYWRSRSRLTAVLSGTLSLLALVLALIGIYGVVAHVVNGRRREIAIRLALGATGRDVQRLIVRQSFRPVVTGTAVGIMASALVSRVLEAVLFGVSPFDPVAYIGAATVLGAAALVAVLLPTREAMRVEPVTALRG